MNDAPSSSPAADRLHVAFVLDRSGSMASIAESVVVGFNDYVRTLRDGSGETRLSLTLFDTAFEHVYADEALERVAPLDHVRYRPSGCTALYDAIGHTVASTDRRLGAADRAGEKVLVVVITDGLENASNDYNARTIRALVASYDARPSWTFVYLGAGHDTIYAARDVAETLGYRRANAMRWDRAAGRQTMESLAAATDVRRRAASPKSVDFFADADQDARDYGER